MLTKFLKKVALSKHVKSILNSKGYVNVDFSKYDIVHFHSTLDLYMARNSVKDAGIKVVLTSHSPKPFHQELVDGLFYLDNNQKKKLITKLEKVDIYAFNNADYIVFPCEEAEEPYFNRWPKYESIKANNKSKYKYIVTGIVPQFSKEDKKSIRNKYNIPEDAFLISYVGRHNEVKGYDILKEIGSKVLKSDNDIYIICAGQEGPIYRLDNKKWIEVGWTNDPHSIINSSDIFVLPNRETYFDLVLLEVLSLGKTVLLSNTGGNKYFKKYKETGLFFFDNVQEAVKTINKIHSSGSNTINKYGLCNKKIYEKDFNEVTFANKYIDLYDEL